jgi:hypothetical protein
MDDKWYVILKIMWGSSGSPRDGKKGDDAMIPGMNTVFSRYTPDELRELYKEDPELFDRLAAEAIKQACIGETPEETLKLLRMQRAINTRLETAKNQHERMETMETIFYGQLLGSDGNLARLMDSCAELAHAVSAPEQAPASEPLLCLVKK